MMRRLVLVVPAKADRTGDFRDNRMVLRTTGFEQFRNARQTTGNILGLGAFQRDTGKNVTGLHRSTRSALS